MKIVLIGKEELQGRAGIGVVNERLKKYLSKKGHEVYELRFAKQRPREENVFRVPYYLAGERTVVYVPALDSVSVIRSYLEVIKPDLVYLPFATSPLDFYLPDVCHRLGVPVVGVWHADMNRQGFVDRIWTGIPFKTYSSVCRKLEKLQVFSKELKGYYISQEVPAGRIVVIPNGVDTRFYCPGKSDFAREKDISRGILFLGRITKVKNPELLIESFLKVNPKRGTKLVMVGSGDLAVELQEEYRDKRIIFTGLIEDPEVKRDVIRSCQIFVLPSKFEGMSLSLLEAMACGLACVATNVGTHGSLLEGVGQVLSLKDLSETLPEILGFLLRNEGEVARMGRKARERVIKEYREELVLGKIEEIFREVVQSGWRRDYLYGLED